MQKSPHITIDDETGKSTLQLGPVPVQYADQASLRPLITETLLEWIKDPGTFKGTVQHNELGWTLRNTATADDPLWRQCMAALSVGPVEFARFEAERVQAAMQWPRDAEEVVKLLCEQYSVQEIKITLQGPRRDLWSVDYCVAGLMVEYPE